MTFSEMKEYEEKAKKARGAAYKNIKNLSGELYELARGNNQMTEKEYNKMQKTYAMLGVAVVDAMRCNDVIKDLNSGDFCCDVVPAIPEVKEVTEDEYI